MVPHVEVSINKTCRGVLRTPTTLEMELSVTLVHGFHWLNIVTKNHIPDVGRISNIKVWEENPPRGLPG